MNRFEVQTRRTRIEALVGFVWEVLTDVEKYGEWNPFTPQARTDFTIGSPAHLLVRMGKAKMQITETVCAFEYPHLIAWQKTFGARWLLHAVREQHLETVSETTCQYHNTDRLTGMLAPLVFLCFGGYMRRGFTDVGDGLRRYSESKYATTISSGARADRRRD